MPVGDEMCLCSFISCNKDSIGGGGGRAVDNWGGCVSVGQGVYGKPLYLPLNFALNLKLLFFFLKS